MKKWILALFFGLALAGAFFLFSPLHSQPGWSYQTTVVDRGRIESMVSTSGTLEAVATVTVGAEISGRIETLYADYNSRVQKGELLTRIDDRSPRSVEQQARADLALAKAALLKSEASLQEVKARFAFQSSEYQRIRDLTRKGHATESELEKALSEQKMARAQIAIAEAEISRTQADLEKKQAALEEARLDVERTRIYSPVDGIVLERKIEQGQTVNANQNTPELFILAEDLQRMQIKTDVDEADIGQVQEGQASRFTVDAYPDRVYQGLVEQVRLAATIESSVVTYTVIISVDNSDLSLYPGMTSNVDIITGERVNSLRIPNSALRFSAPKSWLDTGSAVRNPLPDNLFSSEKQKKEVQKLFLSLKQGRGKGEEGVIRARQSPRSELVALVGEERARLILQYMRDNQPNPSGSVGRVFRVWLLREGKPTLVRLKTGLADQQFTEVLAGPVQSGDTLILSARKEQG